jgi:hypothetical protein
VEATVKRTLRSFLEEKIGVQQDVLSFFQSLRTGKSILKEEELHFHVGISRFSSHICN